MLIKRRFSIRTKLLLIYLLIATPLLVILGISFYDRFVASQQDVLNDRLDIARLSATSFLLFIDQTKLTETAIGRTIIDSNLSPDQATAYLSRIASQHPISNLAFINTSGVIVAASLEQTIGEDRSDRAPIKAIIDGQESAVGNLQRNVDGSPGFIIAIGIREEGSLAGIVSMSIDADRLSDVLGIAVRRGGVNIVDSDGMLIFQSQVVEIPFGERDWSDFEFVQVALSGRVFTSTSIDFPVGDAPRIGAEIPIEELGWATGSFTPVEPVLSPLRQAALRSFLVALVVLAISLLLAVVLGNRLVGGIITLQRRMKEAPKTGFTERVAIRSGDEIESLADSFNRMQEEIRTAQAEQARLREEVEERNTALSILNRIAAVLSQTLEADEIISRSIDNIVELLGAHACIVFLLDTETGLLKLSGARGINDVLERELREVPAREPVIGAIPIAEGSVIINDLQSRPDRIAQVLLPWGFQSLVAVPIRTKEKIIGTLTVLSKEAGRFNRRDADLLISIANQVGVSLENARLYESQRNVASVLQESLLPVIAPRVDNLEIGFKFQSATEAALVGGDFFDFIEISENRFGVIIGDVSGKGIEAATLTATIRNTLKVFAYSEGSSASVVGQVNKVAVKETPPSIFITLFYGIIDTSSNNLFYTNAGHWPPIVFKPTEEEFEMLETGGLPLGSFANASYVENSIALEPGSIIVLFTDGVVESRIGEELFGVERLQDVVREYSNLSPNGLAEKIIERAKIFGGGELRDDAAAMVIRVL